ncbi:hypothetical protein HispidOSU_012106, partial [Sigmodon hispidus]
LIHLPDSFHKGPRPPFWYARLASSTPARFSQEIGILSKFGGGGSGKWRGKKSRKYKRDCGENTTQANLHRDSRVQRHRGWQVSQGHVTQWPTQTSVKPRALEKQLKTLQLSVHEQCMDDTQRGDRRGTFRSHLEK